MDKVPVIYEDDFILVVDKPAGLVVTPSDTHHEVTLSDILTQEFGIKLDRGGIVHRLDKDTSGVLIVAKTQSSLETLQLQFKERMVKKQYLALVHGFVDKGWVVKGAIERNPRNREKFVVLEDGREAETSFEPEEKFQIPNDKLQTIFNDQKTKSQKRRLERSNYGQFTLLRCFPLTGRTHQIRVHLKYSNHPIVGDEKYGGRKTSRLDKRWCPRQFLHAARIEFYHPVSGSKMELESPLPLDLINVLSKLTPTKMDADR